MLAPNSPVRGAVTTLAVTQNSAPGAAGNARGEETPVRQAAGYTRAILLARIYEVLLLLCPASGETQQIIALINDPAEVKKRLTDLGEPSEAPRLVPARGPPLGAAVDALRENDIAPLAELIPEFEFDQRVAW